MAGTKDPLMYALGRAKLTGSGKTQYNHKKEAARFVLALRTLGYGVQRWDNITNRHVAAVVEYWREDRGLSVATVKEYLSGVRNVAAAYGNTRIAKENSAFEIGTRTYITNRDRRVPQDVYEQAVATLAAGDDNQRRFAVQLQLMRELGLRNEEARKLNPERSCLADGSIFLTDGTKGGRDRLIHRPTERQLAAVEAAREFGGRWGNTMPDDMTERQWEGYVYRQARALGISREACGASLHGLRHAYACERYAEITGFAPRCLHASSEEYVATALAAAGEGWQKLDQDARLLLKGELGHGPDRDDVVCVYLGSRR